MSIKITIPNTSSDVLTFGSANTPTAAQIAGIDSGSSNGQLALYTTASGTSTERMRINSSGNVLVGTSTASGYAKASVYDASTRNPGFVFQNSTTGETDTDGLFLGIGVGGSADASTAYFFNRENGPAVFGTNGTERARINSSGNLLVGTTANPAQNVAGIMLEKLATQAAIFMSHGTRTNFAEYFYFYNGNGLVGSISSSGSATTYSTSSDYRLKHDIQPMTGALAKVQQLKPVTYKWNADDSESQGFIAHELQEVVPECVTGEKDGEQMQGVDYGKLTPILTAALQEAITKIETLEARIVVLETK